MIELFNEDCMIGMKRFEDKYFDLAIVDPPYGIGMDNQKKRTKPSRPNSYTKYRELNYKVANWDNNPPTSDYFKELFRVSKQQIIWGANYFNEYIPSGMGWLFWNKLNGENNCFSDGEFAFTSKGVQSRYVAISVFDNLRGGKDRIHPTEKPVALYKWLLLHYGKDVSKILDTHLGSGSIAIACHDAGYDLTGFEIDKDYYDKAVKRLTLHQSQQQLFKRA